MSESITVQTTVQAPLAKSWEYFTLPEHITKWNFASDDWECSRAENDLRVGGRFSYTMAAKDGSASFDFAGVYTEIVEPVLIKYQLEDGRHVETNLIEVDGATEVIQTFDPENENPLDMQRQGWQSILENFRKYVEN